MAGPGIGVLEVPEHRELAAELKDGDGRLRRQSGNRADADSGWECLVLPDRGGVLERLRYYLQHADPAGDASQIAEQVVARLHLLDGLPAALPEAGDLAAGGQELLPGGTGGEIQPVALCHEPATPLWGDAEGPEL
jgi:hypothetical protein